MSRRIVAPAAIVLVGLLASSVAVAHRSGTAASSGAATAVTCSPSAKPKLPDGSPLRLSGIWKQSAGGTAYIRQLGDCYWMLLLSPDGGRQFSGVAHGRIGPRLVVNGMWADTPRMTTVMGSGTFRHKIIVGAGGKITIGAGGITEGPLTLVRACQSANRC